MSTKQPGSWLQLKRVVRFGDTDPAGVIHFHQLFRWSHEGWEESLQLFGLPAAEVFPGASKTDPAPPIALPIVHCQADFLSPIKTADNLSVQLSPERIDLSSFVVRTQFFRGSEEVANSVLHHLAINAQTRKRCDLPVGICRWLEASSLYLGVQPV